MSEPICVSVQGFFIFGKEKRKVNLNSCRFRFPLTKLEIESGTVKEVTKDELFSILNGNCFNADWCVEEFNQNYKALQEFIAERGQKPLLFRIG